jgi:small subunit ribosomal protein S3
MGQKVDPYAIRIGINRTWGNFWYADKKNYRNYTEMYLTVERLWEKNVESNLYDSIAVQITMREIIIFVKTHRPSMIIGQKGVNINRIQSQIYNGLLKHLPNFKNSRLQVNIKIKEVTPETSPSVVCEQLKEALIAKKNYKNLIRYQAMAAMQNGCLGMQIIISGRINGVAIARTFMKKFGSVPLQTLMANINTSYKQVLTKSGCCGVKCLMALAN